MRRTVLVPTMLVAMSLAALLVLALTLAAPLAAQEETTAQPDSEAQTVSKDKDTPSGEPEQSAQEGGKQAESAPVEEAGAATAARVTDSLQEAAVTIESADDGTVERIEIAAAGCDIGKGATVTVDDGNSNPVTFVDGVVRGDDDVTANIEATQDQVVIDGFDAEDLGGFGAEDNEEGEVTDSTGITCDRAADDGGENAGNENGGDGDANDTGQGDGTCSNASEVGSVGPTTDNTVTPFRTTGRTFRVSYDVNFTSQEAFSFVDIDIEGRFGLVDFETVERSGNDSFIVTEDAGSYDVVVNVEPANAAEYSITVEDCAGVDSNTNDDDVVNDPGGNLPDTGGLSLIGLAVLGIVSAAACLSVIRGGRR